MVIADRKIVGESMGSLLSSFVMAIILERSTKWFAKDSFKEETQAEPDGSVKEKQEQVLPNLERTI